MSLETTILGNGLTVVSHHMPHLESVALGLWIDAGSRSETPRQHGLSHLLEHMAFKGTAKRSAREIAETIEAVGGEVNAGTSVDHTGYYARLLKDDLTLGLDVIGDILTNPSLEAAELEREKQVILQEIGAVEDTPEDLILDLFQETAFPGQAIGRSILGTEESIARFTPADLRRFQDTHYRASSSVLAAAGNLDHEALVEAAERHLSGLARGHAAPVEAARYEGGLRIETRPLQEAQLVLGFVSAPYRARERFAANLAASILGGGMASRLFQEAREARGLCYSIYAFQWAFADVGLIGIHAATSEEHLSTLLPVILAETQKLADGVTASELDRAKAQMRAGLLMTLESPIGRATQLARHVQIHGRPLALDELVAEIDRVSPDEVAAHATAMLAGPPTLAALGPVGAIPRIDWVAERLAAPFARAV